MHIHGQLKTQDGAQGLVESHILESVWEKN